MIGRIGVCSWSLQQQGPHELAHTLSSIGASAIQLALDPIRTGDWSLAETRAALHDADITILSGMMAPVGEDYSTLESIRQTGGVRPDALWPQNLENARAIADIARELSLPLVTLHAGFLPDSAEGVAHDTERRTMIDRLQNIADIFADRSVRLAFETGQETAATQTAVLRDLKRPQVGINFDPANMILYGTGEPLAALRELAPYVVQAHVKDALLTTQPGTWGTEVRAGSGAVDWPAFFSIIQSFPATIDLVVEREAGDTRAADIAHAITVINAFLQH
jgi:sugar phosphate isomerase/epimerase